MDTVEVGLPHVAAHDAQRLRPRLTEPGEEALEGLRRAGLGDPEQAAAAGVDLVDEREVRVPLAVLDLVDADRVDALEVAMREPVLDGPADVVPGAGEDARGLG